MQLDEARQLKSKLGRTLARRLRDAVSRGVLHEPAMRSAATGGFPAAVAIGLGRNKRHDYRLAARLQRRSLESSAIVDTIRAASRGECDIEFIGDVGMRPGARTPWTRKRSRPLRIGVSIAHESITAGTLGAFVRDRKTQQTLILSNNHVLAASNRGKIGDAILQPGMIDGGSVPDDVVARLHRVVRLERREPNLVDAALAEPGDGAELVTAGVKGLGRKPIARRCREKDGLIGFVRSKGRAHATTISSSGTAQDPLPYLLLMGVCADDHGRCTAAHGDRLRCRSRGRSYRANS